MLMFVGGASCGTRCKRNASICDWRRVGNDCKNDCVCLCGCSSVLNARVGRGGVVHRSRRITNERVQSRSQGRECHILMRSSPRGDETGKSEIVVDQIKNVSSGSEQHRKGHAAESDLLKREAQDLKNVAGWVAVAAAVGAGVYAKMGADRAYEFVTAYVVEYSLSVDNLFVFLLLFQYFKVPRDAQEKVLQWGVIGAGLMRLAFIFVGEELESRFWWVSLIFAVILIASAVKIFVAGDEEDEEDLSQNSIVNFSKSLLSFSDSYDGDRFWTRDGPEAAKAVATPLLLTLICVELSDVVFALDSVPAVLGISKNLFVVYSSNLLAILGLRSLFFVVEDAVANLRFLQPSLGAVLAFVGLKLAGSSFGYNIDTGLSLAVVASILSAGIGLSYALPNDSDP